MLYLKPSSGILHTLNQSVLRNIPQACSSLARFKVGRSLKVSFWKYFVTRVEEDPPVSIKLLSQGSSIAQAFLDNHSSGNIKLKVKNEYKLNLDCNKVKPYI